MNFDRTWLVAVEYGSNNETSLDRFLAANERKFGCKCIRVRTDILPGQILDNPNEAFEFSGYQEGLGRVLMEANEILSPDASDLPINVVFFNDTLITGHVAPLSKILIEELLRQHCRPGSESAFMGLRMPLDDPTRLVTGEQAYISTWAFALSGPRSAFEGLRFYEADEVLTPFDASFFSKLPLAYLEALRTWLEPTNLLRGWYKAIPGRPLSDSEKMRKMLSIYIEHTLPKRLLRHGFRTKDVTVQLRGWRSKPLQWLRLLDRVYVNYLKVRYRLSALCGLEKI